MAKIRFNTQVIAKLEKLDAVTKASPKYITFAPAFKEHAVRKLAEGYDGWDIFLEAGFPEEMLSSEFIKNAQKRWQKIEQTHGIERLQTPKMGRPKKTPQYEDMSPEEKVAYLEAENAFLVELRAQRQQKKDLR